MPDAPPARLYLVTPPIVLLSSFAPMLGALLDGGAVACVRLALATASEDEISRAADALREVCHARDVPLVIAEHFRLVRQLGINGVHLATGAGQLRAARKALGPDAIVGAAAHASRHDGMTAAEIGVDYVSFGPVAPSSLGDGTLAPLELFAWWSEMIEVPVVAEGGISLDLAEDLAPHVDFLALGDEIWSHPDGPQAALAAYALRVPV